MGSREPNRPHQQAPARRSTIRRANTALLVGLVAVALVGCGAQEGASDSTESPTPGASESASVGTSWTPPGSTYGSNGSEVGTGGESGEPALDGVLPAAADPDEAVEPARAALSAWARPDLSHTEWWAAFAPYLSDRGLAAYEATDPTTIPVLQVTGPARLAPADATGQTIVDVTTTAGVFGVQMVWTADGWAVDRLYFPDTPRDR